tara:strand:+ start:366 stop:1049 length:684 start_codon:yes stop_codon:yes gene_type:complete
MMLQLKNKKKLIFFYLLILITISSINNRYFYDEIILKSKIVFEIDGLSIDDDLKLRNNLKSLKDQSIFLIDKKKLSELIIKNNIVLNFIVKKIYPNKIEIKINKAIKVGKILKNNKLSVIVSNGKLIDYDYQNLNLPYFYGEFDKEEFLKFFSMLKIVNIDFKLIQSFYFFPSGRWDIKFKDGLIIKLPENNPKKSLSFVLNLLKEKKFNTSKVLDLRINNKIISDG